MTSRTRMLERIRTGLRRLASEEEAARQAVETRLSQPRRNLVPARTAGLDRRHLVDLFVAEAQAVHTSIVHAAAGEVPATLIRYLKQHNLPARIVMAPDPALDVYPWTAEPLLTVRRDRARMDDAVGVTGAFAGIAETGTLLLLSDASTPATVHLMPDTHIVILPGSRILPTYEDAWEELRTGGAAMPRTATFVTGPSRTGDIEQRMQLGAHGPRRLHIILVAGDGKL